MWPGVLQTSSVRLPTLQPISLVDRLIHLAAGHGDLNSLGVDPGVGEDLVALFERLDAAGMSHDRALEDLAGPGQPLGVVDIGMRGHDQLAGRKAEVHLAGQLEHVGQLVQEADVDQGVLGASIDQVDVHPHPAAGLVVHLDHAGEQIIPFDHRDVGLLVAGMRWVPGARDDHNRTSNILRLPPPPLNAKDSGFMPSSSNTALGSIDLRFRNGTNTRGEHQKNGGVRMLYRWFLCACMRW